MDDESFLKDVLASLPQEEYQATIITLKAKLREDMLSIDEAETLLDDKYEAMKEINGSTDEGDELALLVGKPHFKKTFKGNVAILANMCIKQLIALEEKQIKTIGKEHKELVMKREDLSQNRPRTLFGNKVIQEGKGNMILLKLNALIAINMDILQEIVQRRMTKQV